MNVTVIGAGLAGCECAWQLAQRGISVTLCEMKPEKMTPAHHSRCSSLILRCADETKVEAGGALAVDREGFSAAVTAAVRGHPGITVEEREAAAIPGGEVVVASGPLTSDALSQAIAGLFPGHGYLNFFDAAAPIVTFDSIDMDHAWFASRYDSIDMDPAWFASRYDKGTADYINCALSEEEYLAFWKELCAAQEAEVHGFEDKNVFEGCMPVEVMARRGVQTLCFGPLKPRGLPDPKTGREPYAVVQLRRDNAQGTLYNLVGFQTHLKWGEQKRVFSMIPALKHAEYVRYGVMHRNTYLDSPRLLDRYYRVRGNERVTFAGQITGVEGYVESTASGFLAGVELARRLLGQEPADFPRETAIGALAQYVSNESVTDFQPMNVNFGIMPPWPEKVKGGKREKNTLIANRALEALEVKKRNA